MTRIEQKFSQLRRDGRKAFIPFITAGDPDLATTRELVFALERAGADMIELGVPFSDPIADGPVIQRATERALKQGTTLRKVLDLGSEIRQHSEMPLLLFSYLNPLLNHGIEKLAADAVRAGFDGILATDLTVEESTEYVAIMRKAGLNTIFLAAPTSSAGRIERISKASTGFMYAVSRTGVTGESNALDAELKDFLALLRRHTGLPIAVGFGISRAEQVRAVGEQADGVIVGSAIVRAIEENLGRNDLVQQVGKCVRNLLE